MNRRLSTLIQGMVRATNNWPALRTIYRSRYAAAARAVAGLADADPAIAAIYARNSYALGNWTPGSSDIDLTVIWRRAGRSQVDRFYACYDRLRERFPMLGEIEMLDEQHLEAWTAHATSGLESARWLTLAGEHRFRCRYAGNEPIDRLRQAVAIYRYNLMPLFWNRAAAERTFLRFATKLFRQFDKPAPRPAPRGAVLAACLRELSARIASLQGTTVGRPLDYARLLGQICPAAQKPAGWSAPPGSVLLGRAQDEGPRFMLVPPDVGVIDAGVAGTVIMDAEVFRFYLCSVDPLEYFGLLRGRTVFHGSDPLSQPYPLTETSVLGTVRHYTVQMLTFPYRRELNSISAADFQGLLYGWFLRTLRYFEDGRMDFQYHTLREYFGHRHLETEIDRFELLHGIADDLRNHLLPA